MSVVFLALTKQAVSSNFHEHYSSLVRYEDYQLAFKKLGSTLDHELLKANMGIAEDCSAVFQHGFGIKISLAECENFTLQRAAEFLAQEITKTIQNRPTQIQDQALHQRLVLDQKRISTMTQAELIEKSKRAFFEFNELNAHTPMSMEVIGWNVRTEVQKLLTQNNSEGKSGIYYLFENYLNRIPIEDRRVVTLSTSANAFKGEINRKVLKELKLLFERKNSRLEFFVVWQRNKMISDAASGNMNDFNSLMDQLQGKKEGDWKTALDEGLIDGFDLLGSLHEGHVRQTQFKLDQESEIPSKTELSKRRNYVRTQLDRVLQLINSPVQLKLHAWEKPHHEEKEDLHEGEYYRVFKSSLEALAINESDLPRDTEKQAASKLRQIRIGHIGGIDTHDIEYFRTLSRKTNTQLIFEANVQSSMANHGVKIQGLVQTIRDLSRAGFVVVLGTDGAGIISTSDAHYSATLKLLAANGLEDEVIKKLQVSTQELSDRDASRKLFNTLEVLHNLNHQLEPRPLTPEPCKVQ